MGDKKYLAFDFGAGSGRAVLGTVTPRISIQEIHRFGNGPVIKDGHYRWPYSRLKQGMMTGLKKAAELDYRLSGIGVDTWGVDFALLGVDQNLLEDPVSYRDNRTDGMIEKAISSIPKQELYRYTGSQFIQINTLYQLLSLVVAADPILKNAKHLLFMPDLFYFALTGMIGTEYTIASTSQLLDARERDWANGIFESLDLPQALMSPIIEPGTVLGPLQKSIQNETGLKAVDVITTAGHDTACAVAAVPVQSKNWAFISSGTWSLMGVELPAPILTDEAMSLNFTNEGGVGETIRFLRNMTGLWLLEKVIESWQEKGQTCDYETLLASAAESQPFMTTIDPDDGLFLNPTDMMKALQSYCIKTGQTMPATPGAVTRCILESLAMKYRNIKDLLESILKKPIDTLHVIGGGSKNDLLNQFTANATGIPVVAGPAEATAIGNILVQAIACGELDSIHSGRQRIAESFQIKKFYPKDTENWSEIYLSKKMLFS